MSTAIIKTFLRIAPNQSIKPETLSSQIFDSVLHSDQPSDQLLHALLQKGFIQAAFGSPSFSMVLLGPDQRQKQQMMKSQEGLFSSLLKVMYRTLQEEYQQFDIKMSAISISQDEIIDLLSPKSETLQCKFDGRTSYYVQNTVLVHINSLTQLQFLIHKAFSNSQVLSRKTPHNTHIAVFLWIKRTENGLPKFSKVSFVQMTQSKSKPKCKNVVSLQKVILNLKEGKKFVPFRDSKLTMILMDSLTQKPNKRNLKSANELNEVLWMASSLSRLELKPAVLQEKDQGGLGSLRKQIKALQKVNIVLRGQVRENSSSSTFINTIHSDGFIIGEFKRKISQLRNQISRKKNQTERSRLDQLIAQLKDSIRGLSSMAADLEQTQTKLQGMIDKRA